MTQQLIPVAGAPDRVVADAIADDHDCVLKSGGTVWCRGAGYPDFYAVVADLGHDVAEVVVGQADSTPELVVCFLPHRNQVLVAARRRSQISSASPSLGHPTLGACPAGGGAALAVIGGEIRVSGSRSRPRPAPGGPRR